MELLMREIGPNEVEQEVTQRDQFNTDTVGLAEALVREALQNSMDGRSKASIGPVRTKIHIVELQAAGAKYWTELLSPLLPHLEACELLPEGLDLGAPRILVIEDFGTTGLLGATDRKDERNFSDFWRRTGRSHKRGSQGGRWGLGKLVFSGSSRVRTFFGITVQEDDSSHTKLLMGQAVLKHHEILGPPAREFAPHAFFALRGQGGIQIPVNDEEEIAAFIKSSGITRGEEPGLSIVVPYVHEETSTEAMLPHVLRNWFFPILTGQLVVDLGALTLDQGTFSELAQQHGGVEFADGRRVNFISALHTAKQSPPSAVLNHSWVSSPLDQSLSPEALLGLRAEFEAGRLIGVRAPMSIRPQLGASKDTYIDLYLQRSADLGRGEAFFVRGAITIPGEARRFRGRNCFGALVAEEPTVAAFLGDAEGPAHTSWSGTAEKVVGNWKNAGARLKEIRESLNRLYDLLARVENRTDPDALADVFSLPKSGSAPTRKRRNPVVKKPIVPPIVRRPSRFRVEQRKGGFVVRHTEHTLAPMRINLEVAYDVVDGDALRQYSKYDFQFGDREIGVTAAGAAVLVLAGNRLGIDVSAMEFEVAVAGFDENRDLFVDAEVDE